MPLSPASSTSSGAGFLQASDTKTNISHDYSDSEDDNGGNNHNQSMSNNPHGADLNADTDDEAVPPNAASAAGDNSARKSPNGAGNGNANHDGSSDDEMEGAKQNDTNKPDTGMDMNGSGNDHHDNANKKHKQNADATNGNGSNDRNGEQSQSQSQTPNTQPQSTSAQGESSNHINNNSNGAKAVSANDGNSNSHSNNGPDHDAHKNIKNDKIQKGDETNNTNTLASASASTAAAPAPAAEPATPVLKGSLYYMNNNLTRKHVIRGSWNFETPSNTAPLHKAQRFELMRTLGPDEDPTELPKDGTFNGSFSLAYVHISAKGKKKEKTKVIMESGVKIKFTERMDMDDSDDDGGEDSYDVNGEGTNQYGVFSVTGTAVRDPDGPEKKYNVELRKRYLTSPSSAGAASTDASPKKKSKSKKRKLDKTINAGGSTSGSGSNLKPHADSSSTTASSSEPLPPPSAPHPSAVVALRGKINPTSSAQDGVIHTVSGMWSSGLDIILSDPSNSRGLCNQFEYEYRGTVDTAAFPISGKYTGWFNLTGEDGTRNRIPERDVTLKFKLNSEGFWNVEGRGSNMFGKYTISGTLDKDKIITIFRHFQPVKVKKAVPVVKAPAIILPPENDEERMSLDDVKIPTSGDDDGVDEDGNDSGSLAPFVAPEDGQFAALHRGVLKVNNDGAITCNGKWAMTKTHYNGNLSSNFHFGLDERDAKQGAEEMKSKGIGSHSSSGGAAATATCFPVDSANYKGSFKMKRGTAKLQSVLDKQICLKFRKNKAGSYNVYGVGVNSFGTFDLVGTLILHGRESGQVELYRIYQSPAPGSTPDPVAGPVAAPVPSSKPHGKALPTAKNSSKGRGQAKTASVFPSVTPAGGITAGGIRRESSRTTKLPSRLEEDDPSNTRLMTRCNIILKAIREKDILGGSFFAEPVDPVAHGIPTYHQIITNPMDLSTIQAKMDADEIESPEQFARLVRLIFDNAIKFNVDPTHIVHQSARNLLSLFDTKFREVERLMEKKKKPTKKEMKEMKKKQQEEHKRLERERKRKREEDEDPTLKKIRLMHSSSQEVAKNLGALKSASETAVHENVTRNEFALQSTILNHLSTQVMQIQGLLATLIPRVAASSGIQVAQDSLSNVPGESAVAKKAPKRPKATKTSKPSIDSPYRPPVPVQPSRVPIEEVPLTLEEQQALTTAINNIVNTMSEDKLNTVIEIIRESAELNDDDDEIDLEIDQLSTATQRKLLNFVNKNKPKQKGPKKGPKKAAVRAKSPAPAPAPSPPQPPKSTSKSSNSFLAFGSNGYASDSDDDDEPAMEEDKKIDSGFQINDTAMEDEDEDDDEGAGASAMSANWNISKPIATDADNDDDDEDDAWAAAKSTSEAQKARDKEREEREKKMMQEAEEAKEKSLAESLELGKKLQEERKAKEAEEARLRKQKEKEEKDRAQKAREEALQNLQKIEPTVDLEGQRDFMKEFEQSYCDKDLAGGASPSSDFGF